jgi:hypothetical protein
MTRHHHHHDMTPLDHDNATATVSITGLALGCYNKATQNYEVGFLRHDNHALTIEVTKKLDGEDSVMLYEIIDHQHRIFIDAENAISPREPIYTVGEDFDRTQLNGDLEDFRWVIDFEADLNDGDQVELQSPDVPVTEMYVSKPRLYGDSALMTQDPQFIVRIDPETNEAVAGEDPELFGFFTEGIKADITCQEGGAVILRVDGPQGFQVELPHGHGAHQITIKNICPPKASEDGDGSADTGTTGDGAGEPEPTDFRLFYSLIVDTAGEKFDIQSPPNSGEGAVCNGSTLGRSPSLFPLP